MSTKSRSGSPPAPVAANEAAEYLQAKLGERAPYWRVFLQNNRRPDRNPIHAIPYQVRHGRPFYFAADLDEFIAHQQSSMVARGQVPGTLDDAMRAIGGWPTGRPWLASVMPQFEEGTGVTFVRVLLSDPLAVYRLDPEQAREVAARLIEAADVGDRATGARS